MKSLLTGLFLAISFHSFSQQPIYATVSGGNLYSFDLANCTRHFIGSTGQGFGDIAFTPDRRLWGIAGGMLYQIDTATASVTLIGDTGVGSVSLVGLNDSVLLGEYGMKLYAINNVNAASYYIDTIGYQAAGDLTWYDDDLYMVTSAGQIIRMVLNSGNTAILSVTAIGAAVPTCEGAITASSADGVSSIVGFNGPNIIKICQIDGSSELLCPGLNIGGTPGAASIRLATQVPEPVSCEVTGVETLSSNNPVSIFPNPAANELNIKTGYNQFSGFNIYNALGQLMLTGKLGNDTTTISLRTLVTGIYTVEIFGADKTVRKVFIAEK